MPTCTALRHAARRRRGRPGRRLLPQRGLLDRVRARDDRARDLGDRLRPGRGPAGAREVARHASTCRPAASPARRVSIRARAGRRRPLPERAVVRARTRRRRSRRPAARSTLDIAFGGAFYGSLDVRIARPARDAGRAARAHRPPARAPTGPRTRRSTSSIPDEPELRGIYGVIFWEPLDASATASATSRSSPTARSIARRAARAPRRASRSSTTAARSRIGETLRHRSIVDSVFDAWVTRRRTGRSAARRRSSPRSRDRPTATGEPHVHARPARPARHRVPASLSGYPRAAHRSPPYPEGAS